MIIKVTLKRRIDTLKGRWAVELPIVLWSYRTTAKTATGETPFDEETNASLLAAEKDMIKERREVVRIRM